jgi:hypothetical protein
MSSGRQHEHRDKHHRPSTFGDSTSPQTEDSRDAGGGRTGGGYHDPALVKSLARAFRYQRMLNESLYASISEMAAAEEIEPRHLGSLLRLTRLSWGTVTMILNGKRKPGRLVHDGLARAGAHRLYQWATEPPEVVSALRGGARARPPARGSARRDRPVE